MSQQVNTMSDVDEHESLRCASNDCENTWDDFIAAHGETKRLPTKVMIPLCEGCIEDITDEPLKVEEVDIVEVEE